MVLLLQGVIAMASGPFPTWIGLPGMLVAVVIGVTEPVPLMPPWLTT